MSLIDGIKRQLRSVIEWKDCAPGLLFYQWTDNGDEIKNASKLIVAPGQGCIFVYEGKVRDVIERECLVDLKTENIPFWTTISRVMQFFESEHKVGIYFFRTTKFLDQKWGTTSSIKYDDPKYKFPVGLRAYGNFSFRIIEPEIFFVNVVGTASIYKVNDFRDVMSDRLVHPLSDFLAETRYSYADIDAQRDEIALGLREKLQPDFRKLGFELIDFRIEGTSFDDDTMRRINRIADVSAEARAAEAAGVDYAQLQRLDAMRDAARNEGGVAGIGVGMGAGLGLGQMMAGQIGGTGNNTQDNSSPRDPTQALQKLQQLYESKLISEQEYTAKKQQILNRL